MPIKIRLFEFWKQKEIETGRTITVLEVARATGISRATLMRLRAGTSGRADLEIVSKLCTFFNVPTGTIPFLIYEKD